ncbi:tetratricopeptide repeat protein [Nocardia sp. NPDC050717]|uniref:tetratricopeptide repeat protein n=1 Tax=Nocardia sp. NPDC050717 TaxID=3157221 RepID=UPI0033D25B09
MQLERRLGEALRLLDVGSHGSAESALTELLADCEAEIRAEHPFTITVIDALGSACYQQRNFPDAAAWHRDAHHRATRSLGPNHPLTLSAAHNLGSALLLMHEWAEGLPLLLTVLEAKKAALGSEHPETLATAQAVGAGLFKSGDRQGAALILDQAYRTALRAYGSDDPTVVDLRHNLDVVLRNSR